ncbi:ribonuclease R [Acetobacterium tundrae]|uniref:Ribonuclease R n=1 Tax=Acetobacterium tundrae TaxID=132932 RepID=A0ABR6WNI9_9FIRM|nr:ribonuclease R [Acetobacterium tundrae]MBC3798001.1 ribonuclease R [Acetobacterium tundrae]
MKTKELKRIVKRLMQDKKYQQMTFDELSTVIGLNKKKERQMLTHVLKETGVKSKNEQDRNWFGKEKSFGDKKEVKKDSGWGDKKEVAKDKGWSDKKGRGRSDENEDDDSQKVVGILRGNQRGFGFVIPDYSIFSEDIYIHEKNLFGALDMDKVCVKIISEPGEKRPEGKVVEIIERGHKKIIGRYEKGKGFGFVIPDNDRICKDIFIPERRGKKARTGDKVVTEILIWSDNGKSPEGEIVEILGNKDEPGIDILSVLMEYDIPMDFPHEVERQSNLLSDEINDTELAKREDLRKEVIFTIDGDDAKDFDDAVSISKNENGHFILGVHIADVSHYVRFGDAIDVSAMERGTSVYVVDRVVPMLPFKLSNDVCSLVPKKDRLTFTCKMEIDENGQVLDYDIFKSVICSKSRMTYRQVAALLDEENEEPNIQEPFKDELVMMNELHEILRVKRRISRGAINFDFPEAKITLDKNGFPEKITVDERLVSHRIIEEFMLVCNETIAEHVSKIEVPFIFRNHPNPVPEKITAFRTFVNRYGFKLGVNDEEMPTGKDFQKLVEDIKGKNEEHVITLLMLRTMQQAVYEGHNLGHYALGAEFYTHFTSPIRRYPDLFVHRYLAKSLLGKINPKSVDYIEKNIENIAGHASETERRAETIEREITKLKMTEYMTRHIGEIFEGRISGVTSFGMFVELQNTIEGLVKLQDMKDDYYNYDPEMHHHIGEHSGKIYRLGQDIKVMVAKADINLKQIDFEIVD